MYNNQSSWDAPRPLQSIWAQKLLFVPSAGKVANCRGKDGARMNIRQLRIQVTMRAALLAVMVIGSLVFSAHASAQSYFKCTNAAGRVVFSDKGCDGNGTEEVKTHRSNSLDSSGFRESYLKSENQALKARLDDAERSTPRESSGGRTESDLQAEKSKTVACENATRSYNSAAGFRGSRREEIKAKRSEMYIACGAKEPDTVVIQRESLGAVVAPIGPSSIQCKGSRCTDNLGGIYNNAGRNNFMRTDGKFCRLVGQQMLCN